ncbi:hypothetical protein [Bradyrhizobium aeschynomenes]|uniref:hypothetical protein n=1 Tax=Bradyrhizobium aeschynomenes TaxID=2734909 RepID=UPI003D315211
MVIAPAAVLPLEPNSVDLATVAQALHWFDRPRAFFVQRTASRCRTRCSPSSTTTAGRERSRAHGSPGLCRSREQGLVRDTLGILISLLRSRPPAAASFATPVGNACHRPVTESV